MEKKQYLECAIIINTHGVRGDVKLESLCDSPEVLASLERVFTLENGKYREIKVTHASIFKQFVLASLEGVTDMDQAAAMKGTMLYASRDDFELDEGDYFIADLIGLPVIDVESGKTYGTVKEVINRGASDIYVVKTPDGERMMPAVEEFVKNIDLEKGIFVKTIPGLLSDD
ncbi:MAG: 16S rRNA processing protein RimM [Clostridia bacterium]|nr:16S rRNA processing protein RimM [Clostridia bacterium]